VALAQQFPGSTRRLEESLIRDRPDPELPDKLQVVVKGVAEAEPRLARAVPRGPGSCPLALAGHARRQSSCGEASGRKGGNPLRNRRSMFRRPGRPAGGGRAASSTGQISSQTARIRYQFRALLSPDCIDIVTFFVFSSCN
jgi:hypothetical protein